MARKKQKQQQKHQQQQQPQPQPQPQQASLQNNNLDIESGNGKVSKPVDEEKVEGGKIQYGSNRSHETTSEAETSQVEANRVSIGMRSGGSSMLNRLGGRMTQQHRQDKQSDKQARNRKQDGVSNNVSDNANVEPGTTFTSNSSSGKWRGGNLRYVPPWKRSGGGSGSGNKQHDKEQTEQTEQVKQVEQVEPVQQGANENVIKLPHADTAAVASKQDPSIEPQEDDVDFLAEEELAKRMKRQSSYTGNENENGSGSGSGSGNKHGNRNDHGHEHERFEQVPRQPQDFYFQDEDGSGKAEEVMLQWGSQGMRQGHSAATHGKKHFHDSHFYQANGPEDAQEQVSDADEDEDDESDDEVLPAIPGLHPYTRQSLFRMGNGGHQDDDATIGKGDHMKGDTKGIHPMLSLLYGFILSLLAVPWLYGYASVLFRAEQYRPFLPELSNLLIVSSIVHQFVFTMKSSLPFAISQVQDAGIIFLSAMATSIADGSSSTEEALSTTLITLPLSTALLGLVITFVGRKKLASMVALVPSPVIAGYLAYIGYFCAASGTGLAAGVSIASYQDWVNIDSLEKVILLAPAWVCGVLMYIVSDKFGHIWWALPLCIACIPATFYVVLAAGGWTLDDARAHGWVTEPPPPAPFYKMWEHYNFAKVNWSLVPQQFLTWLSMVFVLIFSSTLDIVAVEMDCKGMSFDLNKELQTVGISNMLSGLTGGFSGSYIFGLTIFTRHTGELTRRTGLALAFVEILIVMSPLNVMSLFPKFFFGSTLVFIGVDLFMEWMYKYAVRVTFREAMLVVVTFLAMLIIRDVVGGIFVGVGFATLDFMTRYAEVDPTLPAPRRSKVLRAPKDRRILEREVPNVVLSIKLSGYLFFGSATTLVNKVREQLAEVEASDPHGGVSRQEEKETQRMLGSWYGIISRTIRRTLRSWLSGSQIISPDSDIGTHSEAQRQLKHDGYTRNRSDSQNLISHVDWRDQQSGYGSLGVHDPYGQPPSSVPSSSSSVSMSDRSFGQYDASMESLSAADRDSPADLNRDTNSTESGNGSSLMTVPTPPRRYLILDFSGVSGMDATAVSTGVLRICLISEGHNLVIVFTSVKDEHWKFLNSTGVISNMAPSMHIRLPSLEDGLEWVESRILIDARNRGEYAQYDSSSSKSYASASPFDLVSASTSAKGAGDDDSSSTVPNLLEEMTLPATLWEAPSVLTGEAANRRARRLERTKTRLRKQFQALVRTYFGQDALITGTSAKSAGQSLQRPADAQILDRMCEYWDLLTLRAGQVLFDSGDPGENMYYIMHGEIGQYMVDDHWKRMTRKERLRLIRQHRRHIAAVSSGRRIHDDESSERAVEKPECEIFGNDRKLVHLARYGSLVGEAQFVAREPRVLAAMSLSDVALFVISHKKLSQMEESCRTAVFQIAAVSLAHHQFDYSE